MMLFELFLFFDHLLNKVLFSYFFKGEFDIFGLKSLGEIKFLWYVCFKQLSVNGGW